MKNIYFNLKKRRHFYKFFHIVFGIVMNYTKTYIKIGYFPFAGIIAGAWSGSPHTLDNVTINKMHEQLMTSLGNEVVTKIVSQWVIEKHDVITSVI